MDLLSVCTEEFYLRGRPCNIFFRERKLFTAKDAKDAKENQGKTKNIGRRFSLINADKIKKKTPAAEAAGE
jgi:hypothetical protein